MNDRAFSDAEFATALRAHLPSEAAAGLHERITATVAATPQLRRLPWVLSLGDADPILRRRALLLVAAVALVAATVATVAVGAWLRSQDPIEDLNPSSEVDTFVLASYERVADLPPFRLVLRESHGAYTFDTVYFYDGVGVLREEQDGVRFFGRNFAAEPDRIGTTPVWVVTEEAGHPLSRLLFFVWVGAKDCETGWESLETVDLIGRPTRHVRCTSDDPNLQAGFHLWIDLETGLPLRSGQPLVASDEAGSPVPMGLAYFDVVELEFGDQAAELFRMEGLTMSIAQFACATEGPCASTGPSATEPAATPIVSPEPAAVSANAPPDIGAFVAGVRAAYERAEPVDVRLDMADLGWYWDLAQWQRDGLGNYRAVPGTDETVVFLMTQGRAYEVDPRPDGRVWRDWGPWNRSGYLAPTMGLPDSCGIGWKYLGDDLVLDRPAAHLACGFQEFWIDREWMFVTRAHDHDPMLGDDAGAGLSRVLSVTFGPQQKELFEPPSPDLVWSSR